MTTREDLVELMRDGNRYRRKRGAWERFWLAAIVGLILAPFNGWLLMLAIDIAHNHWWPEVPTIGYWWAVLLAYLFRAVFVQTSSTAAGASQ